MFLEFLFKYSQYLSVEPKTFPSIIRGIRKCKRPLEGRNACSSWKVALKTSQDMQTLYVVVLWYEIQGFHVMTLFPIVGEHRCFRAKPTLHPLLPSPNTWEPIPHNYQHVLYGWMCRLCTSFEICWGAQYAILCIEKRPLLLLCLVVADG